jgi:hypothetical protein
MTAYETQALLGLGVSRCQTRVSAGYRHNTDTYNYIELCYFFQSRLNSIITKEGINTDKFLYC